MHPKDESKDRGWPEAAARKAAEQYDVKTFQSMMRDKKAKARG